MDSRPAAAESNQSYHAVGPWSRVGVHVNGNGPSTPRTPGAPAPTSAPFADLTPTSPYPPTLDLLPLLVSQHQAQLLQYNKLISPGRGGGGGLLPTSIPGGLPVPCIQAAPRSRSSSKVSNKDNHSSKQSPATQSCHGIKGPKNPERPDREGMTMGKGKEQEIPHKGKDRDRETTTPKKMSPKTQPAIAHTLASRPAQRAAQVHHSNTSAAHSSSVPSTPHQRARNSSFESRDPSPTPNQGHSPRSAYSEPNGGATHTATRPYQPHRPPPCPYETAFVKFRRRMPYSLGNERLEKINLEKIKSKLSESEERKLSTDMRELYDRLLPSPEVEENRKKLVQKLEKIFNDEWPGHDIQVHLFGSSGNLLCSDDSDVDICITTDWKEMEGVCIIADLLKRCGMEKVVCISGAKVPIVKIWDPELKLACDMNVNNTLALENTRMVRTYVEIDERVRPLAMILKYWTRRRVVNDAAFGYTLSSYTWICMIIVFLQLRDPPILPALHQCPHLKLPTTSGHKTDFADDLNQLQGFGVKNESTWGELLFQFFRFYAHEFDYDNMALSVRLGKMIPKSEKKWHVAMNNMLCVEEPFNRERNLGNTADDFSFRGLHLELRRAFDLVADAKLDECCEQFVFPKEEVSEAKPFIKQAPRPAIIRSSSQQQHPGRGGRNGGSRGGRNSFRNGNSSRRASSSNAYENAQNSAAAAAAAAAATAAAAAALPHPLLIPAGMTAGDLQWSQLAQHYPYHGDMAVLSNALNFAQHDRWQWYAQQQLHQQAVAHAQRMQAGSTQTAERSRTNSFDQAPPLTAPPRPEYYVWPPHLQPTLYPPQHHAGFGTYPSSPSASTAAPEFRRSLHRSNAATESGSSSSSGTLRSQSQPASRTSAPTGQPSQGYVATAPTTQGVPGYAHRQPNLSPFPAFASDDRTDSEADEGSSRTLPDSPPEEDSAGYLGYFVADSAASTRKPTHGIHALSDMGLTSASRRRLSTEGPQAVLDRRLQRTSRSPSPLGHGRAISAGTSSAPLASATFQPGNNNRTMKETTPLVVNGSTYMPASNLSSNRVPPTTGDHLAYDNPLHISQGKEAGSAPAPEPLPTRSQVASEPKLNIPDRPLVVNGSTQSPIFSPSTVIPIPSFGQRVVASHAIGGGPYTGGFSDGFQGKAKAADAKWQRLASRQQQAGIAPLDLAIANPMFPESQHLSPVYEHRTPSPTVFRERSLPAQVVEPSEDLRQHHAARSLYGSVEKNGKVKNGDSSSLQSPRLNGQAVRENGSLRATKGDAENGSGWKTAKSRKKQLETRNTGKTYPQSEQPPKNESERKGG